MKGKYLQSKPGDVVDEITSLKEKYIYFLYDEILLNTKKVTRIAILMMERGVKKKYISWEKSDIIISASCTLQLCAIIL